MKILVAADGSKYTERMLTYLATHPEWLGPQHQYTVFCGVPAVPPGAAAFVTREAVTDYYDAEAQGVFASVRKFFADKSIEASFVHKVGHPAEMIAKLAEDGNYDLVMMGSHGHGLLGNLVLGSVATKVLAGCSTPVLLVR